ncbi:MAG TPA: GNAT family N-acetyltransferase [Candidatus Fimivivens sp.]|nr:GNAT family N-acetyltransferase [Candidatus Fimivivens sp.]
MNDVALSLREGFCTATEKDIVDLLRADDETSEVAFEDPGEEEVRTWEHDLFLTAWNGDMFAGFGRARADGWVTHVFVSPKYRRKGFGSVILTGLEAKLRMGGRETALLDAEPTAVAFFMANGWVCSEQASDSGLRLIPMRKRIGSYNVVAKR